MPFRFRLFHGRNSFSLIFYYSCFSSNIFWSTSSFFNAHSYICMDAWMCASIFCFFSFCINYLSHKDLRIFEFVYLRYFFWLVVLIECLWLGRGRVEEDSESNRHNNFNSTTTTTQKAKLIHFVVLLFSSSLFLYTYTSIIVSIAIPNTIYGFTNY